MQNRKNISSGSSWEDVIGYSRAVRIGNVVEISGTTASDNGKVVGENNPYEQTQFILAKVEKVLVEAGATMNDVIRTRIFLTDISRWEEVAKAHGEFFRNIKPATTIVEVKALIDAGLMVEIEISAVVGG
ncbi:MAG: RidA family protein [Bacteroidota bacterium]